LAIVRLRATDLKHALEAGALSLHYQPQVEIKTGKLAGVEAFVRWVIGAICRQAKQWRTDRVPVPIVAANVWTETLRRPDALRLIDALAETGVDPRTIELECPRGSTVDPDLTKALTKIHSLGVRLASEEYAAVGHANGKLRFDTLKIPYPISRDHVANAKAIVAVVDEAEKTGARVVADSVETVEQEQALASLGVEIVQGYLYGPEVTPGELRTLITRPGSATP